MQSNMWFLVVTYIIIIAVHELHNAVLEQAAVKTDPACV